jgi:ribosome-associated heat shock protein Hsp15
MSDHQDTAAAAGEATQSQRLDKWLWFARVTKSRTLAAQLVLDGKVRVNRVKAAKPSQTVRVGDVLTITVRGGIDVVKVLAPGARRGPPPEARQLYEVITSPGARPAQMAAAGERVRGAGRPTKRDRRLTDRLTEQDG